MYNFDYQRPANASAAAAAFSGDARYLAGGQSLVQAMKLRLNQSERLIDLGGVAELAGIRQDGNQIVVGATTRHSAVAASAVVQKAIPAVAAGISATLETRRAARRKSFFIFTYSIAGFAVV